MSEKLRVILSNCYEESDVHCSYCNYRDRIYQTLPIDSFEVVRLIWQYATFANHGLDLQFRLDNKSCSYYFLDERGRRVESGAGGGDAGV
jgi:hypothetical protein